MMHPGPCAFRIRPGLAVGLGVAVGRVTLGVPEGEVGDHRLVIDPAEGRNRWKELLARETMKRVSAIRS
jgi:hypothetical protein